LEKKLNYKVLLIHSLFWAYELFIILYYGLDLGGLLIWSYSLFILVVYLHYFVLVPRIIKKPSLSSFLKWYAVFFLITFIRKQVTHYLGTNYFEPWGWMKMDIGYEFYDRLKIAVLLTISNSSGILAVCLGSRYFINKDKAAELESQKINNELNALKNQIDIPETINILSKLEQKAKSKPESIQDEIIELSNVLRYHLYSKEGEVILSKELGIVQNQLDLYNKLNHSSIAISLEIDDRIIKTGILSKAVGEVLKHTQKVNSVLEINGIQKDTFLKISDGDSVFLSNLRNRIENMFSKQVDIENTTQTIIIKLN
jgi:hypothetical protein